MIATFSYREYPMFMADYTGSIDNRDGVTRLNRNIGATGRYGVDISIGKALIGLYTYYKPV